MGPLPASLPGSLHRRGMGAANDAFSVGAAPNNSAHAWGEPIPETEAAEFSSDSRAPTATVKIKQAAKRPMSNVTHSCRKDNSWHGSLTGRSRITSRCRRGCHTRLGSRRESGGSCSFIWVKMKARYKNKTQARRPQPTALRGGCWHRQGDLPAGTELQLPGRTCARGDSCPADRLCYRATSVNNGWSWEKGHLLLL